MAFQNKSRENTHIYVLRMGNANALYITPSSWTRDSEITWNKYTIRETDLRIKTATFSSPEYFDLTTGKFLVLIASKDHPNFSGVVLSVEYDDKNGIYNYQCQDWARNYLAKFAMVNGDKGCQTTYHNIRCWLSCGAMSVSKPHTTKILNKFSGLISGLRPMDMYNQSYYGNGINFNPMKNTDRFILKDTTFIDAIRTFIYGSGAYIDLWFNDCGVLQIEPFAKKDWIKTGLNLSAFETSSRNFKFDTTNVITSVMVNGTDFDMGKGYSSSKLLNNFNLSAIFGNISASINTNVKAVANTKTDKSQTNVKQAKLGDNPYNTKRKYLLIDGDGGETVSFLKSIRNEILKISTGWTIEIDNNIGPGAHSRNYSKVKNGCYMSVYNGLCVDTITEMGYGYYGGTIKKNGSVHCPAWDTRTWNNPTGNKPYKYSIEKLRNLKTAHDWRGRSVGSLANPHKYMTDKGVKYCLAPSAKGIAQQFLAGGWVAYNKSGKSHETPTKNKEHINTIVNYANSKANQDALDMAKAREKIYEHARDFLTVSIRLPLGNLNLKEVHTNQWLFTKLPYNFDLANWTAISEVINSNYNRYEKYVENSWYVEDVSISVVAGGKAEMTLKLNGFATNLNKYKDNKKNFIKKHNDAKAKLNSGNNNTKSNNGNNSNKNTTSSVSSNNTTIKNGWWGNWVTKMVKSWVGKETDTLKKCKIVHEKFRWQTRWTEYNNMVYTGGSVSKLEKQWHRHKFNCGDGANYLSAFYSCCGAKTGIYLTYDQKHYIVKVEINGKTYWCDHSGAEGAYNTLRGWNKTWHGYRSGIYKGRYK